MMQHRNDLQPHAHGAKRIAIGDRKRNPATRLAFVQSVCRRELRWSKAHARNLATIEFRDKVGAVNPRRTEMLEGRIGSAPDGDTGGLQNLDARIWKILAQSAQVGRGRNPRETSLIIELDPVPIF